MSADDPADADYPGGLAPTTGAGYADVYSYDLPDGCVCYWREDIDWGDVRTPPPAGCPVHPANEPLDQL